MKHSRARLFADIACAATIGVLSVWIYEGANFLTLFATGSQVSVDFQLGLPVATEAIGGASADPAVKVAQVVLCLIFGVSAYALTRRNSLRLSESMSIAAISIYLASTYWEYLGSLQYSSYAEHVLLFFTLSALVEIGALAFLGLPRWGGSAGQRFHNA